MTKEGATKGFSKVKLIIIATLLAVLCVGLAGLNIYQFAAKDTKHISSDSVREEIVPVAKMTTYEYNFTQIMAIDNSGNPFNIKNPITRKLYVATVDGVTSIGIDTEAIECNSNVTSEGVLKSVSIVLPPLEDSQHGYRPEHAQALCRRRHFQQSLEGRPEQPLHQSPRRPD